MNYSKQEVMQFIEEEDVKFVRLAFCDVFGKQKNISIMYNEIARAFEHGIAIDSSAIRGFGDERRSDLFLHPDPSTLVVLPWRPEHGRVVRMYCDITYPDGTPFALDTRRILKQAVKTAEEQGVRFQFGGETEFYLFKLDENGNATREPFDTAGYMDIAPDDKSEKIRREICLTLEQMGISPESSHHEEGPGQNEIDFRYSSPVEAADNTMNFCSAVNAIVSRSGVFADFSPKPLKGAPGNGFHINFSVKRQTHNDVLNMAIAGILSHIEDMTVFLNPCENSYDRLGSDKAPAYVSWSHQNRAGLIRIPAASGKYSRAELRSPDPQANPYLAFALLIYAGLDGINRQKKLGKSADINFFTADEKTLAKYKRLPANLAAAALKAKNSAFIKKHIPQELVNVYCNQLDR